MDPEGRRRPSGPGAFRRDGNMTRTRILIAAAVAVAVGMALAFGGVFAKESQPSAQPAPAQVPIVDEDPSAAIDRLLAGFSTGDTAGFVRTLEQNVAKNRYDVASLTLLGLAYQQRQRETGDPTYLDLSEKALRRAVSLQNQESLALTGLATLSVARHRWNDALTFAKRALERNPDDASALAARGDALLNLGRYDKAFPVLDRVAVLSPSAGSFARVSYARELLGRRAEAIEAIALSFELNEGVPEHDAWARVQLGNLHFDNGDLPHAERAYAKALDRYPGYIPAEAGLARVEAAHGAYDSAVDRLRHVVDVLPTPQYAILLGDVLTAAGRTDEAADAYALVSVMERLLGASGVRTELQTALFDLDRNRDIADALERAREAYDAAPSIAAEDVLAWALYKNGRCGEARKHSASALRLGTLDALMLFHRGMIERCSGDVEASHEYIRKALDVNPHFSFIYGPLAKELAA